MPDTAFDVSRYDNRNGVTSWRVAGWLHGLRIRKNFKSREEAAAEAATLEIKALQATSGLRSLATTLTDEQAREAEAAFRRLADKPRPLSFYLDFTLANYREPESQKSPLSAPPLISPSASSSPTARPVTSSPSPSARAVSREWSA